MASAGALGALSGARVRRIDMPWRNTLAIGLDAGCTIVVGTGRSARGVGLVDARLRTEPADALVRKLRAHLVGAVLVGVEAEHAALLLSFIHGAEPITLVCALDGAEGAVVLLDGARQVLHSSDARTYRTGNAFVAATTRAPLVLPESLAELEAGGELLLRTRPAADREAMRGALTRAVRRGLARATRRLEALDGDLASSVEADTLRVRASLLLAHAHELAPGATEIHLVDDSRDPPHEHLLQLRRPHGASSGPRAAIALAQKLFVRARKLETGARIAAERKTRTLLERTKLAALLAAIDSAPDDRSLAALAADAHALGVVGAKASLDARADASEKARRSRPEARLPYRRFLASGERAVLVGRGAADNDALTLHHARPQDLWLHARSASGAHVIVPLARGEICPPALLLDAATLAAHFSDARGEPIVDVQHTARRFVRKPRRSAPGAVVVDREKVLALRLDPARLAALLARETLG